MWDVSAEISHPRGVGRTAPRELEEASSAIAVVVDALNAALHSFWRRFWNHMIRKLGSESSSQAGTSCSLREEWELGSAKGSDG